MKYVSGITEKGNSSYSYESQEEALAQQTATTENNGGKTGWPPGLLQDDCKGLSKWLSNQPDAKRRVREALAEESPQQEPVAQWQLRHPLLTRGVWENCTESEAALMQKEEPTFESRRLYTSPPAQRTWVGLTQEQIENCYGGEIDDFARAIEAKSKELNQ